ncbi:MAG: helix-turn-helix transcriptional regulator [Lachnospiraceae bacterium]|nr:helix-turn-helix transcriptional regulator [Lachnospiraceae bacterium]
MGQRIRELRLRLGISMAEFGRQVGYSPTHIARLEQGGSVPRKEFIEKLCGIFNVKIEYFTGDLPLGDAMEAKEANADPVIEDVGATEDRHKYDGGASERIKAIRAEMGLSQRAFANMAGVNNSLISEVEASNRELSISAAKKIEAAFDIGYEWLLYGMEEKKEHPVSDKLVSWLWSQKEIRRELWERMEKGEAGV